MKIIFFGTPPFVQPVRNELKRHYEVINGNNSTIQQLNNVSPDLFVVAAYGKILSAELLAIPKYGALNIHPSLLPQYRGPTPVQTALLNNDTETGVTIIKLDEEIDHGPILAQVKEPILPNDTAQTLHERLFKIGSKLLIEHIPSYVSGKLKPIPQDDTKATYTEHLTRESGYIDSNNPPPKEKLERMIKAYYPWPGAWSKWMKDGKWKILKFLPENKLQVEGGKPMSIKDFLNGYPELSQSIKKIFKI